MWSTKNRQDFIDSASTNLAKGTAPTGFSENFRAAARDELASGLSISEYIMKAPIRERNQKIRDLANTDPEIARFRKVSVDPVTGYPTSDYDYGAAADYLVERGDEGFQSTAELNEQISESVKQANKYRSFINEGSSGMGIVGDFAGSMATQVAEPVNYVAVIPGIGQASSLALKTRMAIGATEAAAAAALVTPVIKQWKNANDIEYTTQDAFVDIGFSAAFGAGLSGLAGVVSDRIGRLRSKSKNTTDLDEREAFDAAAERLQDMADEIEGGKIFPEDAVPSSGQYFDRLDDMAKALAKGEDTWVPPESTLPDAKIDESIPMLEQALGVKRERPKTAEGVDVDPDAPDKITVDESKFDFEVDGVHAAQVVKDSDSQIKRLEKAMTCMLGG